MTAAENQPDTAAELVTDLERLLERLRMYAVQVAPVHAARAPSDPYEAHTSTMSRVPIAALLRPDTVEHFNWQGRTYYRFRNDTYMFPADDREHERMDILHELIYPRALDNQLHLAHLRTSPQRILDVGFGTAYWMYDVAKKYPEAEVIGMDLDAAKGMPSQMSSPTSPGCYFKFPVDFTAPQWPIEDASVDLVHMAQLLGSVSDWLSHYRKAYRCLRPGVGHIEHVEIDWTPRTTDPSLPPEARELYNWWYWVKQASDIAGKSLAYREDTEDLLEQAGFRDVSHRRVRIPLFWNGQADRKDVELAHGYQMAMGHEGSLSFHGFTVPLLTRYLNWSPQQVQDLCDRVLQIIQSRPKYPQVHITLHVWTARRPQT